MQVIIPLLALSILFYMVYHYCRMVWYRNTVLTPLVVDFIDGDFPLNAKITVAWFHELCLTRGFVKQIVLMNQEMLEQIESNPELKAQIDSTDVPSEFENIVNYAMSINHRAFRWVFWWYKFRCSLSTMKIRFLAHQVQIERDSSYEDDDKNHFGSANRHSHA
ncbi:hypothetical protein QTO12_02315 [Vibrio owensii]|uniref:hypothetical protein n=1 Tax=Vibrio owensii TaxID=696485 RepID=UPI002F422667